MLLGSSISDPVQVSWFSATVLYSRIHCLFLHCCDHSLKVACDVLPCCGCWRGGSDTLTSVLGASDCFGVEVGDGGKETATSDRQHLGAAGLSPHPHSQPCGPSLLVGPLALSTLPGATCSLSGGRPRWRQVKCISPTVPRCTASRLEMPAYCLGSLYDPTSN